MIANVTNKALVRSFSSQQQIDKEFEEFRKEHEQLAFATILNNLEESNFVLGLKMEIEKSLENYEDGTNNYGIISQVKDKNVIFIHKTFQEYFISCFLIRNINEFEIEELIFQKILVEDEFKIIRLFFNAKDYLKNTSSLQNEYFELNSCLFICASEGLREIVEYLVENGADVNTRGGYYNETALMYASRNGCLEVVKYLIKNGAIINAKCFNNCTALTFASEKGHLEIVKCLIKNRADVNAKGNFNQTALIYASIMGRFEIVKYLVENGADVNAKSEDKYTSVIIASLKGFLNVVEYLVENGAKINEKNKNKQTALILASEKGHFEIVKCLVEKDADLNAKDKNLKTSLILASQNGHLDIVKYLVENGADVNAKDKYNHTALTVASEYGHHKIVDLLSNFSRLTHKSPLIKDEVKREPLLILKNQDSNDRFYIYENPFKGKFQTVYCSADSLNNNKMRYIFCSYDKNLI
jgi:ankyrin repeat protein